MKIISKYFFREFFRYFAVLLLGFSGIAVIAEFFDKASEFYREDTGVSVIAQYLLLSVPQFILYALPFASLFSILITIGISSRWKETVVIKASGRSTKKFFSSFLVLGFLIALAALLFGEAVVPSATRKADELRRTRVLHQPVRILQQKDSLWLKGLDGSLIRINGFVEDTNRILKTSMFRFTPSFSLAGRIEANEAEWHDGIWTLREVTVFDFVNDRISRVDALNTRAIEEPKIFREEIKKPQEMNFLELHAYYKRLEKAGFINRKSTVRLYEKLAFPAINFVMILFGVALALNSRWGGGIIAAGLGVLVSVLYWVIYSFSISFGNTGILAPWLAPWVSPLLFCIAGIVLYVRIRE